MVLGEDWTARLVIRMLGLCGNWHLCLDRTNWKIGRKEINLLVLAVATRRYRVPLIWTALASYLYMAECSLIQAPHAIISLA